MRKFLSILVIVGLIIAQVGISQPVSAQSCGLSVYSYDNYIYVTYQLSNTTGQTQLISGLTYTWGAPNGTLTKISSYPPGGVPENIIWTGSASPGEITVNTDILVPVGAEVMYIAFAHPSVPSYQASSISLNCDVAPTSTPTPYGGATATPTPTPTETPRPNVESTVVAQMVAASNSISVSMQNIQPYDWQSGGATSNFPNLFDGAIAPYFSQIFSYMLALMEIVNTNNVVVIIFILTIGISILMIVIKMVSGGALAGWKESGIPDAVNDPYRSINKRK